ncbi:MAG: glutathione S-transferase family protein [Pseudomonadota bacterium]
MAVTVYDHPLSPYGQKVKIALNEKGVEYGAPLPTGIGSGSADPEFAAGSPRGEVPLLLHEEAAIFDSSVILAYIEEVWPNPALLPATARDRARVRMLEETMDTHYEAITWGLSEVRYFHRASGAEAERFEAIAQEQLMRWHAWLAAQLADRPWFNGDAFGWGDLCVLPFVNGAVGFGYGPDAPALTDWLARANARDSVAPVVAAAAAVAFDSPAISLEAVHEAMAAGLFKRQYRDHRLEWMVRSGGLGVVADGLAKDNIRLIEPFAAPG